MDEKVPNGSRRTFRSCCVVARNFFRRDLFSLAAVTFSSGKIHKICIKPNAQALISLIKLCQLWRKSVIEEKKKVLAGVVSRDPFVSVAAE